MIINSKVLNIPPFISTHWNQVEFLTTENSLLLVQFKSGKLVSIPDLSPETLALAFESHAVFLNSEKNFSLPPAPPPPLHSSLFGNADVKIGFSSLDPNGIGIPLQHMEELREAPDLPEEVLEKIKSVAKLVPIEDLTHSPKPLDSCNCPFCQIAAVVHSNHSQEDPEEISVTILEEEVKDEDLTFNPWNIFQKGDQLYEVQNKLDKHESYNVFLGEPIGCTCGKDGCEHILAVLKS